MDNNAKMQKLYEQLSGTFSEEELDAMLNDEVIGAGSLDIVDLIISCTTGFDWCPTGACTYSCRF